jgi:hypothetical protein
MSQQDEILALLRVQDARLTAIQRELAELRAAVDEIRPPPSHALDKVQQLHAKFERLYVPGRKKDDVVSQKL